MRAARGKKINPVSAPVLGIITKPRAGFWEAAAQQSQGRCGGARPCAPLSGYAMPRRAHVDATPRTGFLRVSRQDGSGGSGSGAAAEQRCCWVARWEPTAPAAVAVR